MPAVLASPSLSAQEALQSSETFRYCHVTPRPKFVELLGTYPIHTLSAEEGGATGSETRRGRPKTRALGGKRGASLSMLALKCVCCNCMPSVLATHDQQLHS